MKIRHGFVSNSSSASFIVAKSYLTEDQTKKLIEICKTPIGEYGDNWEINDQEDEYYLKGFTCMDNVSDEDGLEVWLKNNGYPLGAFRWNRD